MPNAVNDAKGFVKHGDGETIIIDEIQKAPCLLNAIKMVVDKDNAKDGVTAQNGLGFKMRFAQLWERLLASVYETCVKAPASVPCHPRE